MYMSYVCMHARLFYRNANYLREMNKSLSVDILRVIITLPTDSSGE